MSLPNPVAKFIEDNIDLIETSSWKSLFTNWYISQDDYWLYDFFYFMKQAGIDAEEESFKARKYILTEISKSIFAKQISKRITYKDIVLRLNSCLGFDNEELHKIFDEAALSQGFIKSTNGWYIV